MKFSSHDPLEWLAVPKTESGWLLWEARVTLPTGSQSRPGELLCTDVLELITCSLCSTGGGIIADKGRLIPHRKRGVMKKGKRRMDDTGDPNQKKKKVYEMSTKLIGFCCCFDLK